MGATPDVPDDDLIEAHREEVRHLLVPMVARYELGELGATPEGRAVLGASPELRVSLAVAALAGPRSGWTAAHVAEVPSSDQWPAELIRALVRRRIDWDPDAAALALRLVAAGDFDDERFQLVLKAADRVAEAHPGHPGVMDGLDRLATRAGATSQHRYRVPEMRARVTAAIARHAPPELLDLSPIADADTWGPAARATLEAADARGVDVRSLLGCLTAGPSATAPSARWLAALDPVLTSDDARGAVEALVRLLVDLDLDDERPFVAVGNDTVARAALWALGHGEVGADDVALLRDVALRCSRTNGRPYVTEALCGRAVGAAITVLGRLREGDGAVARTADGALAELWDLVERGDVLRRIGRTLGRDDEAIATRVAEAKRSKAEAKAERVNPRPAARAERLGEVIDVDLAERLRRLGFDDRSRRTFRRHHPGRTEVVAVSIADAEVRLRFGVGFHPASDRPRWRIDDLDVAADLWLASTAPEADGTIPWLAHRMTGHQDQADRRASRGRVDPLVTLADLLARFDAVALPALDRWAHPGQLADDLDGLEVPFPHGELLLGLELPDGAERRRTVRRLRRLPAPGEH
jgi:hypothetical protein